MKKLKLMYELFELLSYPIIRIYLRSNRLQFKLLCFIVLSVDYQVFTKVLKQFAVVVSKRRQ